MTPQLSVVIVSWNSAASLGPSFEALRRSVEDAGAEVEVVVVDNASTDDSLAVARGAGADRTVANPLNAGYVLAASQGIALSRAPWVMLANPDLVVGPGFVRAMLEAAATCPADVAALVPDIRYAADPRVVNSRGITVDAVGVPAEHDAGRLAGDVADAIEVFGPSTSGCVLRRSALEDIGGLEPLYFAYLEDVDVAWRLRKRGYRALVVPGATAVHEGSASTGEGSWLKAYLVARNRRALFRLHGPGGPRARVLRAVTELGHATVQTLSGSGTASFQGRLAALATRRYTRFLQEADRLAETHAEPVALAPREPFHEALRRKRAAAALMRAAARGQPARETSGAHADGRLRVFVDATNLKPGQGGIRSYTVGLIGALAARPELSLVVASSVDDVGELGEMEVVRVPARTRSVAARGLWRERHLARLARVARADVILTPVPELPLRKLPVPSIAVVHDVGPLVAPAFYSAAKRLRYRAVVPRTCRLADTVVCVSHTTLVGLHAALGVDPGHCEVIGEGAQPLAEPGPGGDLPALQPYVLYVGSLEPRKNVRTLVAAFGGPEPPAQLVVVGPRDPGEDESFVRAIAELGAAGRVRHFGFVPTSTLTALYRGALAVALPSLYEGFGLPVIEAMERGTPVVASDIEVLREVAADAALFVDRPLDPACWREAVERLAGEPGLRAELRKRGAEAVARHSWDDVGARFSSLLHRVAGVGVPADAVPEPLDARTGRTA